MSAALEAVAASQGGPFTARQAWEVAGYSKGFIRHRVWSGRWIVLRRGIYVDRTALEARGESDGRRHAISVAAALLAFGSPGGTSEPAGAGVGRTGRAGERDASRAEGTRAGEGRAGEGRTGEGRAGGTGGRAGGGRDHAAGQPRGVRMAGWPPAVVGSHQSAARVYGLDLLNRPGWPAITRLPTAPGTCSPPGVQLYRARLPERHLSRVHDVAVTAPARTVVDLARTLSFMGAVVVADAALRARLTNPPELRNVLADCRNWPGVQRAARVVAFADPWAESAFESIARVVFAEQRLPPPQTQVPIIDGAEIAARVDFYWKEHRTIAETDGLLKYTSADVLRAEKLRQERLADLGYEVVRITWAEITKHPAETAARIRRAFGRAGTLSVSRMVR